MRRRTALIAALVLSTGLALPALSDGSASQACAAYSSSSEASDLPASFPDSACTWVGRVIRDGGVGVTVPARGEEVRLDAIGLGGSRTLRLLHRSDGRLLIYRDAGSQGSASSTAPPSKPLATCSDGAFSTEGFKVSGGYSFSYNGYSAPASVASGAATAVSSAFTRAAGAATDCTGATRQAGPAAHYLGAVSGRFANITTSSTCSTPDAYNTVSWLNGDNHTLALTCMWFANGVLRYSDAAINRTLPFFTGNLPDACTTASDLSGVMTHEAGHTYGLGHADAGSADSGLHSNQTMNSQLAPCTTKYRTFGTGDLNGMTSVY